MISYIQCKDRGKRKRPIAACDKDCKEKCPKYQEAVEENYKETHQLKLGG